MGRADSPHLKLSLFPLDTSLLTLSRNELLKERKGGLPAVRANLFSTTVSRFVKSAMTERLCPYDKIDHDIRGKPSPEYIRLYKEWGRGEIGVIVLVRRCSQSSFTFATSADYMDACLIPIGKSPRRPDCSRGQEERCHRPTKREQPLVSLNLAILISQNDLNSLLSFASESNCSSSPFFSPRRVWKPKLTPSTTFSFVYLPVPPSSPSFPSRKSHP